MSVDVRSHGIHNHCREKLDFLGSDFLSWKSIITSVTEEINSYILRKYKLSECEYEIPRGGNDLPLHTVVQCTVLQVYLGVLIGGYFVV
jgi:hypothetical protein